MYRTLKSGVPDSPFLAGASTFKLPALRNLETLVRQRIDDIRSNIKQVSHTFAVDHEPVNADVGSTEEEKDGYLCVYPVQDAVMVLIESNDPVRILYVICFTGCIMRLVR